MTRTFINYVTTHKLELLGPHTLSFLLAACSKDRVGIVKAILNSGIERQDYTDVLFECQSAETANLVLQTGQIRIDASTVSKLESAASPIKQSVCTYLRDLATKLAH